MRRFLMALSLMAALAGILAVVAFGAKALTASPTSLQFGDVSVNGSKSLVVEITNNTDKTLTYDFATDARSSDFSIGTFGCNTVAASASCGVEIQFNPTVTGRESGSVGLNFLDSNGRSYKVSWRVVGTGV